MAKTLTATTDIRYWYLEYRSGSSNKFYEIYLNHTEVILTWGRIGTEGQSSHTEHADPNDAKAKALAQVYAKEAKGYSLVRDDFVVTIPVNAWRPQAIWSLRSSVQAAISRGEANPREQALNYIEGFVDDCNTFLVRAKEGEADIENDYFDLRSRFAELKDKFDSAETMMDMVSRRAMKQV